MKIGRGTFVPHTQTGLEIDFIKVIEERLVRKEILVREDIQGQKALKERLAGRDKKVNKEIAKIRLQKFYRFCYDQSILLIPLILANSWA